MDGVLTSSSWDAGRRQELVCRRGDFEADWEAVDQDCVVEYHRSILCYGDSLRDLGGLLLGGGLLGAAIALLGAAVSAVAIALGEGSGECEEGGEGEG
jgi:hypothetical protein